MSPESSGAKLPLLSMLAVAVVWGGTYSQIKQAIAGYPLFALLALRFTVATLALTALPHRRRPSRDTGVGMTGAALGSLLAAGYALQTLGLERISATATGFTTGLFLPLTPLLAAALFGERVASGGWIATALASVGLFLLAGGSGGPLGANLLVLGAAGCFALHLVLTGRVACAHEPRRLALVQMAVCASAFTIIALTTEPLQLPRELSLWAAILVTGVLASAVGFAVQTWAQRKLTAIQTAIAITAEPVSAGLVGLAFAGEHLTFAMLLGCVAILLAIFAAQTLHTKAT